jgi:hypothetical protein
LNSFNASPSALWLSSFFTGFHFDSCHRASFAVFDEWNILFSLKISGKCLNTYWGMCLLVSTSFHLESVSQHTWHTSSLTYFSLRNNTQLFWQTWIFS